LIRLLNGCAVVSVRAIRVDGPADLPH
jgi:hypothetical protein